ncbi:MAG: InlB B-repeat-containing protein [Lachnospiraceae bacterium]|jgi:pilin isopeptide linkage protein/uncharacterized repeat protein (TIGR02543 family)|nr:InlB B-repeat-containing protein [Lachnospiraceae bacterium]
MKTKMKHRIQKALAVLLISACTFSINLNVFADSNTSDAVQSTLQDGSQSQDNTQPEETIQSEDGTDGTRATQPTAQDGSQSLDNTQPEETKQSEDGTDDVQAGSENETNIEDLPALETEGTIEPQNEVTITFDLNGGKMNGSESVDPIVWTAGTSILPPDTPTKDGCTFDGWYYKDASGSDAIWDFNNVVTDSITLTAKWTQQTSETITVTFDLNGGNYGGNTENISYTLTTSTITEPDAPVKDEFVFDYWYYKDASGSDVQWDFNKVVTESITLTARWLPKTITANCEYNGTMSSGLFKLNYSVINAYTGQVSKEDLANLQKASTGCYDFDENGKYKIDLSSLSNMNAMLVYECDQNSADINYDDAKIAFWVHRDDGNYFVYPYVDGSPMRDAATTEPLIISQNDSNFDSAIDFINKKNTPSTMTITATKKYVDKDGSALPMSAGQFKLGYLTVEAFNGNVSEEDLAAYRKSTSVNTVLDFDENGKCVIDISGITNEYAMLVYECGQTNTASIDYSEAQNAFWVYKDGTESCVCPYLGQGSPAKDAAYCVTAGLPVYGQNDSEFNSVIEFTNKKIDQNGLTVEAVNKFVDQNGTVLSQSNVPFSFSLSYLRGTLANKPALIKTTSDDAGNVVFDLSAVDFSPASPEFAAMAVFKLEEIPGTNSAIKYNSDANTYYVVVGANNDGSGYTVTYFKNITDAGPTDEINKGEDIFTNILNTQTVTANKKYTDKNGNALSIAQDQFVVGYMVVDQISGKVTADDLKNLQGSMPDSDHRVYIGTDGTCKIDLSKIGDGNAMLVYEGNQTDSDIDYADAKQAVWIAYGSGTYDMHPFMGTGSPLSDAAKYVDEGGKVIEFGTPEFNTFISFTNRSTADNSGSSGSTPGTPSTPGSSSEYVPASKYPAVIDPLVQKLLGGDAPDTAATFTFSLKAEDPKFPMPSGSSNGVKMVNITGAGSSEFGKIAYYQPGTYTYTCYEVNDGIAGYTYDTSTFTMKVVVVDAGDRLLATRTIVRSDGNAADGFVFGNWYTKAAVMPAAVSNITAPTNPDVPKTADSYPLYLFLLMLTAGSAGIITVAVKIHKNSRRSDQ